MCHERTLADKMCLLLLLAAASPTLAHLLSLLASPTESLHTAIHPRKPRTRQALNKSSAMRFACSRSFAAFDQPPQAVSSDEFRSPMRLSSIRPRECAAALALRAHACGGSGVRTCPMALKLHACGEADVRRNGKLKGRREGGGRGARGRV